MDVLMIVLGLIIFFRYAGICGRQRRPLKTMIVNSAAGVIVLVLAAVITGFVGCGIAVDYITVFTAAVLGIPGVAMMLAVMFLI